MWGKQAQNTKVTSDKISEELNSAVAMFTIALNNLKSISNKAAEEVKAKDEEIKALKEEQSKLLASSSYADRIADNISKILN